MRKLVICTAIAFMMVAPAYADIAVSITGGSGGTPVANSVHGWELTVNTDIILTDLGLYDLDLDGFILAHDIGLFRLSDGALLASGTMSAGMGDPLIDNFRYIDVVDVPLVTTENYVLSYYSAPGSADFVVTNATGEVFAPEVNWISGRWGGNAGGLIIPPNSTGDDRYGPNFQFVTPGNCPWDLDGDGVVGVGDLLIVVHNFGPCDGECPADFDGDGFVGASDLLALIANFGECPGTGCPWDVNGDGVVDRLDVMAVNDNMGSCKDPDNCPWDVNGDGVVDGADVSEVATHFGPCPKE